MSTTALTIAALGVGAAGAGAGPALVAIRRRRGATPVERPMVGRPMAASALGVVVLSTVVLATVVGAYYRDRFVVAGNGIYVSPGVGLERGHAPQLQLGNRPAVAILTLDDGPARSS